MEGVVATSWQRRIDLGLIDYKAAYNIQKRYVVEVKSGISEGHIIFAEHPPVITLGRTGDLEHLRVDRQTLDDLGIDIQYTDRGGDITFHGPGQLIAYPVLDLSRHDRDIHKYLRNLEEAIIRTLAEFNILAYRIKGLTGVWAENRKIASIGIGVSSWVTYHGLAINANTDLRYFDLIYPCGLTDIRMASMNSILQEKINLKLLKDVLFRHLCNTFLT